MRALLALLVMLLVPSALQAAVVEGRIIHPTNPHAVADIEVTAIGISMDPNAPRIEATTRSDGLGNFLFDLLPAPAAYLIRATYRGIAFPGGTAVFHPGDPQKAPPLSIHVYEKTDDVAALSLAEVQWVIERDAGVYHVGLSVAVNNTSLQVVSVPGTAPPALRIGLPAGHSELKPQFGVLPEGVSVQGDQLEFRGPVLPGGPGLKLNLSFDLSPDGDALDTELAFPDRVESVSVFVRDFGIAVDADGLHPARPARQDDQFYLSFVGFELSPGATHRLRVTPLPPANPPPNWLTAGLVALLAGGLLFLVGRPVVEAGGGAAIEIPEDDAGRHADALAAALRDLEFDFETGKLSQEDRDRLHDDLRRDAARALARERATAGTLAGKRAAPDAEKPHTCVCGREFGSGDRFCASCGREL